MSDRDTFGPSLRAERQRRGISLETIAAVTRVGTELWEGLERNDFSRWPSGIFARAFMRDYARAIGLDADEVVNEFCRLFPIGDRRADRIIKAQGELIGHSVAPDTSMIPKTGDRRASGGARAQDRGQRRFRLAPRAAAALLDTAFAAVLSGGAAALLGTGFWTTAGVVGLSYYGIATVAIGFSPGTRVVAALRTWAPSLFAVHDGAHA